MVSAAQHASTVGDLEVPLFAFHVAKPKVISRQADKATMERGRAWKGSRQSTQCSSEKRCGGQESGVGENSAGVKPWKQPAGHADANAKRSASGSRSNEQPAVQVRE